MGEWKQKLRFFGGPLNGEVHEVDEYVTVLEVYSRPDIGEEMVIGTCEEGLLPDPSMMSVEVVQYERCYYHQKYRNGTKRAWPHMFIMGKDRHEAEMKIEDMLKEVFDVMFGDTSRNILCGECVVRKMR